MVVGGNVSGKIGHMSICLGKDRWDVVTWRSWQAAPTYAPHVDVDLEMELCESFARALRQLPCQLLLPVLHGYRWLQIRPEASV